MPDRSIRALTFDLDDTLWPVAPVIANAEQVLRHWLERHAPATAAAFDAARMRELRIAVEREQPSLAHDVGALRLLTLRRAVESSGEPAALADAAFDVFLDARQQVQFFPDVLPALQRLSLHYPLLSISNGNADLGRVGLGKLFRGSVSAQQVGCAKPDRRIFDEACRRLGCEPVHVLHIGDHPEMDVAGARAAGLTAIWLRRISPGTAPLALHAQQTNADGAADQVDSIADLDDLVRRLGC